MFERGMRVSLAQACDRAGFDEVRFVFEDCDTLFQTVGDGVYQPVHGKTRQTTGPRFSRRRPDEVVTIVQARQTEGGAK